MAKMKALFLVQLILFLGVSYVTLNDIMDCGTDYSIQNGFANFAVRSTIFQENVPVTCMNGYELYGDEHITCLEDGKWSGNVTCRIKNCKNTFHLEHGHAEFSGDVTPYGGMVPVVCSEGYEIEGDHVITCLADGNWSTSTSCRVKDCGTDYHLENGHVNFTGRPTLINHTVPVLCDDGYYIQGDHYITCLSDGTWSQYTRCRSTSCGIEYKYREKSAQSGLWPSITSRYSTGYCVAPCEIQSYQIRCERTPNFNQSCRIEECDAIFNNAAVANFGFNLDCGTGFKRKKVVHFSEFALIPVNCDIKDCGTRYSLSNGYADFSQSTTTYNATAPVKCDHGYRMAGPAIITCLANGTWSHAACLPIDCGSSYTLEHGAVDFTGIKTTFQHTALVYCDEGYRIQGSSRITCQSDGQWSQSTRCQLISCGTNFVIEHGYANFNTDLDLTYNQSISVTCQIGYIMVGNPNIICQADGNWHGAGECQKLGFQQALKRDLFAGTPTGTAFVDLMSFFPQRKKTDFIAWTTTNTSCVKDYELNDMILKVRHSGYKTLCKLRIMVWELQSTIHDFFVTVEYYGCWPSGDGNGTYWKVANLNTTHVKVCPEPYTGTITRLCNDKGTFNEPNYNCTKSKIGNIISELDRYIKSQDILNADTVAKSLQELANATLSNDDGLNNTDVKFTVNLLDKLTGETVVKQTRVHEQILDIADNLFDVNNTRAWQQLVVNDSYGVENLIDVIEKTTMHIIEDDGDSLEEMGPKVFLKRNLMLSMGSTASCLDTLTFPDRSSHVTDWVKQTSNLVQLHCNSVNASDSFSGAYYKNISKLFSTSAAPLSSSEAMEINSGVMTFTIFPKIQKQLNPEIEIRFQLFNGSFSKPTCSFWIEDSSFNLSGRWATGGCHVKHVTTNTVTCSCNHVTNFAILMSPSRTPPEHLAVLGAISITGCVLSMICLFITMVVYIAFWRQLKSDKSITLVNLCASLFVAYLVFLAGVSRTENKNGCTVVAVMLHFIYLVVFLSMLAEGVLHARMVLFPLNRNPIAKKMLIAVWAAPAIIVAISSGATSFKGYGNSKFCWLSVESGLIWAFVAPALLTIMINIIIISIVFWKLFHTSSMMKKSDMEKAKSGIWSMCVILPLVGVTWVMGVFSVNEELVVFQYIFALLNSLQGLAIFIFHCVFNTQVREALMRAKDRLLLFRKLDAEHKLRMVSSAQTISGTNGGAAADTESTALPFRSTN